MDLSELRWTDKKNCHDAWIGVNVASRDIQYVQGTFLPIMDMTDISLFMTWQNSETPLPKLLKRPQTAYLHLKYLAGAPIGSVINLPHALTEKSTMNEWCYFQKKPLSRKIHRRNHGKSVK